MKLKWNHLKPLDLPTIDTDHLGQLIGMQIPEAYEDTGITDESLLQVQRNPPAI